MNDLHVSMSFGIGGAWLAEYTLAAVHASVVVFDGRGRVVQWDERASEVLGLPEEPLAGLQLHDRSIWLRDESGDLLTPSSDPVMRVLDHGEAVTSLLALQVEGGVRLLSGTFLPIYGPGKQPNAVLASFVDTSPWGGCEHVAEIDRRLDEIVPTVDRAVFDDGVTANLIIDGTGHVAEWNHAALQLVGRSDIDLIGAKFSDLCVTPVEWLRGQVGASDQGYVHGRTSILRQGGGEVAVFARASNVTWAGVGGALLVQLLDPHRPAAKLHWRPEDDSAFDHVVLGLLRVSRDGRILAANPAASALLDRSEADLVGADLVDRLDGLHTSDVQRAIVDVDGGSDPAQVGVSVSGDVKVTVLMSPGSRSAHPDHYLVQLLTTGVVGATPTTADQSRRQG